MEQTESLLVDSLNASSLSVLGSRAEEAHCNAEERKAADVCGERSIIRKCEEACL